MDDEKQLYRTICRIRELFSGRFTDEEASFLLERFHGDEQETTNFVLHSEPADVRRAISEEQDAWKVVGKISRLKEDDVSSVILDRARTGRIDTAARMFACQPCDHFWWRRTPDRKTVSKCDKCHKRYDALSRDREWGWAEFHCSSCQRRFNGYCAMWMTSPCYRCETESVQHASFHRHNMNDAPATVISALLPTALETREHHLSAVDHTTSEVKTGNCCRCRVFIRSVEGLAISRSS